MALTTVPVELANLDGAVTINESSADVDFRVESNGNANMLFVDAGNDVVSVGYGASIAMAGERHELEVFDTNFSTISAATFRNGSDGASITLGHSRSGTIGTQTVLQDGDTMGAINFVGSDGTDMASYGARIYVEVDGTPGSNDMPGKIKFATTADGANGSTDRMIIGADGDITATGNYTITKNSAKFQADESGGASIRMIAGGSQSYLGNYSNHKLNFITNSSTRGYIANDGEWVFAGGLMAIGTTSRTGGASGANVAIEFAGDNNNGLKMRDTDTNAGAATFVFVSGSSIVGSVTTSSSSTTYNTSSDYRLKENVNYDWDALTTLKQLKPAKFNFKTDTDKTVEGFLAHEVSGLVPAAVTGEKDAMETRTKLVLDSKGEVLEEGVEEDTWTAGKEDETYPADSTWEASKEYPSYQQIDQSKLVPLMVKAIQELEAKVKALEEA